MKTVVVSKEKEKAIIDTFGKVVTIILYSTIAIIVIKNKINPLKFITTIIASKVASRIVKKVFYS